ncbi:MAG TPA: PEP-CTERM sorting domain-containing protein [Bryobacteraceae bacterium]|nr:PEP-CTERM sorting domain-containing protein [Bryobacteraceae bacterium]
MKRALITALLACLTTITVSAASFFNAETDFTSSNPNGVWTYGSSVSTANLDTNFILLPNYNPTCFSGVTDCFQDPSGLPAVVHNTTNSTANYLTVSQPPVLLNLHPGTQSLAVVRWTAPYTASWVFSGQFESIDSAPTGVDTLVADGSSTISGQPLAGPTGTQSTFLFSRTVAAGSSIYFAVGNAGNLSNDSTGFNVAISDIPEPGTIGMIVAGLGLTLIARRRKV